MTDFSADKAKLMRVLFEDFGGKCLLKGEKLIIEQLEGRRYHFMDPYEFQRKSREHESPWYLNKVYAQELLRRCHWAAASTLIRQNRWAYATMTCIDAASFLGTASTLRAWLEAAADSYHSLRKLPYVIIDASEAFYLAINGAAHDFILSAPVFEDELIHFAYARRIPKSERSDTPESHIHLPNTKYIANLDESIPPEMGPAPSALYAELCEIAHPAHASIKWHLRQSEAMDEVFLTPSAENRSLAQLISTYQRTISHVAKLTYDVTFAVLLLLNEFDDPDIATDGIDESLVERFRCRSVPDGNFGPTPDVSWACVTPSTAT